jgi:hypothetical protein
MNKPRGWIVMVEYVYWKNPALETELRKLVRTCDGSGYAVRTKVRDLTWTFYQLPAALRAVSKIAKHVEGLKSDCTVSLIRPEASS